MNNPARGHRIVSVGPGELYVTRDAGIMIRTVLGSCVAACIRDPVAGVGGLNHFMLPGDGDGSTGLRFGRAAMHRLIEDIEHLGGQRGRLEVKLFGGACFKGDANGIGERNAAYAGQFLATAGLVAMVTDFGGQRARRILYSPATGRVFVQKLRNETAMIA